MRQRPLTMTITVLIGALSGCGEGCEPARIPVPEACESELLENTVEASAVGRAAGISAYRYRADVDAAAMDVDVITDGNPDVTMRVEQVGADAAEQRGTMKASLGGATLTTRGGRTLDGQRRIFATVERGETMHIEVDLAPRPCFPEDAGPVCTGALDLTQSHVLLPSCGLDYDEQVRNGTAMVVTALRYISAADGNLPEGVGSTDVDGERWAVVNVIRNGVPRAADVVQTELDAVGGAFTTLPGDADVRLLLAAYLDPTWRRTLALHAATCIVEGDFVVDEIAQDQAALTAGNNASRDSSSWGGNDDNSSKGGGGFWGDPHMGTFDGVNYDFQATGDYLLARSTGTDLLPLEVQSRFVPLTSGPPICRQVSVGTSNVVSYDGRVYEASFSGVLVDGAAVDVTMLPPRATLSGYTFTLLTNDGTEVELSSGGLGARVRILPSAARVGTFVGLLGDADGDADNDFRAGAENAPLARPVPFDVLYGTYREAWRLDAARSLFTYAAGEGPDDFYIANLPSEEARLDLIEDVVRIPAEAACRAQGLSATGALFDCVLDVVCVGAPGDIPSDAGDGEQDANGVTLSGDIALAPRPDVFDPGRLFIDPSSETCAFPETPVMALFDEGEHVLDAPLAVDQTTVGAAPPATAPLDISVGRSVRTYLVHLPPGSDASDAVRATLRFASPILALQFRDATVRDARFVPDGQSVEAAPERGVRLAEGAQVTLADDRRGIEMIWSQGSDAEQMRIVLEVTP